MSPAVAPASHAYLRGPPGPARPPSSEAAFRGGGSSGRRGAALARVDTKRRSGRSSLRLRRKRCAPCALRARHSLPSRPCDTTSSKRARCFLGMKILQSEHRPPSQARSLTAFQRHLLVALLPIPRGDQGNFHFGEQTCISSLPRPGPLVTQQVEVLAVKPEEPSSIPRDPQSGRRELTILDYTMGAASCLPNLGKSARTVSFTLTSAGPSCSQTSLQRRSSSCLSSICLVFVSILLCSCFYQAKPQLMLSFSPFLFPGDFQRKLQQPSASSLTSFRGASYFRFSCSLPLPALSTAASLQKRG